MGKLRLASTDTVTLDLGDGDSITVRSDITKRVFNSLVAHMPSDFDEKKGLTPAQGVEFQKGLFEALVVGWSMPIPASVENYLDLAPEAAAVIDTALADHFSKLTPSRDESTKSEGPSEVAEARD